MIYSIPSYYCFHLLFWHISYNLCLFLLQTVSIISMVYLTEIYTKFRSDDSVAGFAILSEDYTSLMAIFSNCPDGYFLKYIHEVLL